jgi:predicted RNA-binding protein with PUA-like domain
MAQGDEVFVYHSVSEKAVVGLATVVRTAYPDPTVGPGEKAEWVCVDLKAGKAFPKPVSLEAIKAHRTLKDLLLVRQSRLSVSPLGEKDAAELRKLGGR